MLAEPTRYDGIALTAVARARLGGLGPEHLVGRAAPRFESSMSGPTPSTLVLLSDLPRYAPGQKVRFLGWYYSLSP